MKHLIAFLLLVGMTGTTHAQNVAAGQIAFSGGGGGGSGGGDVHVSGTPVAGQTAQWTAADTIAGISNTGSGLYVLQTSPTLITPILGVAAGTSLTLSATTSLLLGTAGSAVGNIGFRNATSGTATLGPPTGALGTYTVTLPNAASTLPIFGQQITFAGPTAARTVTFPDAAFTAARTDAGNTFTGASTASAWVLTSPTITTGITPTTNDGAALGTTSLSFADLFLANGAVINWNNGNVVLTHTSGVLTLGTGNLIITTAGTATGSVVTTTGTQTVSAKRITRRLETITDATPVTFNLDNADIGNQSAVTNNTTVNAPTHTSPQDGDLYEWAVTSSAGAGKTLTWNAIFVGSADLALPATLSGNSLLDILRFRYNTSKTKYIIVGRIMGI